MPSPPHLCAHPNCQTMVKRKEAKHCRSHRIFSPEYRKNLSKALKGRQISVAHRKKISEAKFGTGENPKPLNRICEYCDKEFTVKKPSSKVRFCSRSCGYSNRQGPRAHNWQNDMPVIECRTCGTKFRLRSATMKDVRFTCSYTCKNVWQRKHQKTINTDIEQIVEKALKKRGWPYRRQVGLCNITTVDFYLPHINAVIYCDGDYWHSKPEKKVRDKRQALVLQEAGYIVYRFWGSAIHADVDTCLSQIKH